MTTHVHGLVILPHSARTVDHEIVPEDIELAAGGRILASLVGALVRAGHPRT